MRRMTRYILGEFLKLFVSTLVCMTVVLVVVVVGQEAVRQGLGADAVLKLMPYALPVALLYAVPGTTLFTACSLYGRISATNEVTAIKSLGLSPMTLLWPTFAFAFLISLAVVWLNDFAVSWGRVGVKRVVLESMEQIAYGMLRANRTYADDRFSINVAQVDGHLLIRPTLRIYGSADDGPMEIRAETAELHTNMERGALLISFTNGEFERGNKMRGEFQGTETVEIPLDPTAEAGNAVGRPSDTPLRDIAAEVQRQSDVIQNLEQQVAVNAAYQMLTGDFAELTSPRWGWQYDALASARERLFRLHTEPWRRWANGFSCLAFVLVGAPLAIRLRNADVWTSFIACFLPILVLYYPLLAYGVDVAKSGRLPPYCVWLGNGVLVCVGYWMTRRVIRY